jgi:hypothetical protein
MQDEKGRLASLASLASLGALVGTMPDKGKKVGTMPDKGKKRLHRMHCVASCPCRPSGPQKQRRIEVPRMFPIDTVLEKTIGTA